MISTNNVNLCSFSADRIKAERTDMIVTGLPSFKVRKWC